MKRKPTFTQHIGSIRSASHLDDLIPNMASELHYLLKHCRVDRETRKAHVALVREAEGAHDKFTLGRLEIALSHYAPPYTYFGARDGDYGFWPEDIEENAASGMIDKLSVFDQRASTTIGVTMSTSSTTMATSSAAASTSAAGFILTGVQCDGSCLPYQKNGDDSDTWKDGSARLVPL